MSVGVARYHCQPNMLFLQSAADESPAPGRGDLAKEVVNVEGTIKPRGDRVRTLETKLQEQAQVQEDMLKNVEEIRRRLEKAGL